MQCAFLTLVQMAPHTKNTDMHHVRTFSCGLAWCSCWCQRTFTEPRQGRKITPPPPPPHTHTHTDPQPPPTTPVPNFYIQFPHRYSVFSHGATSKAQKRSRTRPHKNVRRATWVSCSVRVQAGRYPSRPPPLWLYPHPTPTPPPSPSPTSGLFASSIPSNYTSEPGPRADSLFYIFDTRRPGCG